MAESNNELYFERLTRLRELCAKAKDSDQRSFCSCLYHDAAIAFDLPSSCDPPSALEIQNMYRYFGLTLRRPIFGASDVWPKLMWIEEARIEYRQRIHHERGTI